MRRAVALLARLQHHALEQERLGLGALRGELARQEAELARLDRRFAAEHAAAFELAGGPRPLAAYTAATQARRRRLHAEALAAAAAVAAGEERLRAQARRWKSLDLVEGTLRTAAQSADARRTAATVEEAAQLRAALRLRTRGPG
jgi:hypothetical protein